MNVVQIIRILSMHKRMLIVVPILFGLVATYAVWNQSSNYESSSRIYTGFASGYSIKKNGRNDFYTVKTKFDNFFQTVKSRSIKEEVVLRTLALYLSLDTINENDLLGDNQQIIEDLKEDSQVREIKSKDKEEIFKALKKIYYSNYQNNLYLLLNTTNSSWNNIISIYKMSDVTAYQEGNSDIVVLGYESNDPGLTYNVIATFMEVLEEYVNRIKYLETNDVVAYFQRESKLALDRLNIEERELSKVMTANNITNYYEQTKWLASRNEDFELAFQQEKLSLAGALAAEKKALKKLAVAKEINTVREEVLILRKELSRLIEIKTKGEIKEKFVSELTDSSSTTAQKNIYADNIDALIDAQKQLLQNALKSLFVLKNSASGIDIKAIGNEWIDAVIKVEEFGARIQMYKIFREEFKITYARLAKLGSIIKQLERKIAVCEKDYLDLLGSLNDAKLMQQNLAMGSTFKVVDAPYFPVNSAEKKKILIIILSAVSGVLLVVFIIILLEFLDNSIKTAANLNEITGLTTLSSLPVYHKDNEVITTLAEKQMLSQVKTRINISNIDEKFPFVLAFCSTRKGEGKTHIREILSSYFQLDKRIIVIDFNEPKASDQFEQALSDTSLDFIFIELPSLFASEVKLSIMKNIDMSILIAKATRLWESADQLAFDNYNEISKGNLWSIINGVSLNELENMHGELPKSRGVIRKQIKDWLKLKLTKSSF